MDVKVYRAYYRDSMLPPDASHLFSIVATDSGADYAHPNNPEITKWNFLNQDRIQGLLETADTPPTSPLEWATMASYNLGGIDVMPVTDVDYEDADDAMQNEGNLAEDAWYKSGGDYGI